MPATVPAVEIADDADAGGVGCPDCETGAMNATDDRGVSAEFAVNILVRAFAQKIKIEFAQRRRESVGVLDNLRSARPPGDAQRILALARRHRCFKESPFVNTLHGGELAAASVDEVDRLRAWLQRTNNSTLLCALQAQ